MNIDIDIECQECYRDIKSESDVVCRDCHDSDVRLPVDEWLDLLRKESERRPDLSVEGLIDNWRWTDAVPVAYKQQTDPKYAATMAAIAERDAANKRAYEAGEEYRRQGPGSASRVMDALEGA